MAAGSGSALVWRSMAAGSGSELGGEVGDGLEGLGSRLAGVCYGPWADRRRALAAGSGGELVGEARLEGSGSGLAGVSQGEGAGGPGAGVPGWRARLEGSGSRLAGGGRRRRALAASWEAMALAASWEAWRWSAWAGGLGRWLEYLGMCMAGLRYVPWADRRRSRAAGSGRRDTNSRSYELAGARWGGLPDLTAVVSVWDCGRAARIDFRSSWWAIV
jgi:hypothetical protein